MIRRQAMIRRLVILTTAIPIQFVLLSIAFAALGADMRAGVPWAVGGAVFTYAGLALGTVIGYRRLELAARESGRPVVPRSPSGWQVVSILACSVLSLVTGIAAVESALAGSPRRAIAWAVLAAASTLPVYIIGRSNFRKNAAE